MRSTSGSRFSTLGLVAGNAIPLVGVLAFDWSVAVLLVVYWVESGVVGASFFAKILRARGEDDPDALPALEFGDRSVASFVGNSNRSIAGFFALHYGAFWVVHGAFVADLVGMPGTGPVDALPLASSLAGLGGYHVASFWLHFVVGDEATRQGPATLMVEPYRRVFVLHLTVVVGGFVVAALGAPVALVAVLVLLKTLLDVRGHWREHERADDGASTHASDV
jgi:hypothetical protein